MCNFNSERYNGYPQLLRLLEDEILVYRGQPNSLAYDRPDENEVSWQSKEVWLAVE